MQHHHTMTTKGGLAISLTLALFLLTGCSEEGNDGTVTASDQHSRGHALFQAHCASCHGSEAQGAENWQRRNSDGSFPPPPLNGTGHAWHHPKAWLFAKIKYGGAVGQGVMPSWEDKLTDEEIEELIGWFQSRWPEEIYDAWQRRSAQ